VLEKTSRFDFMRVLGKSERCLVMGVLNVTPDSFSDGGRFQSRSQAVDHAAKMIDQGVDILDIGGESTRPNADPVSVDEEIDRVVPVIEKLRANFDVPISVDTSKAEVMREGVAAGATMINDVRALQAENALSFVAESGTPVCLMHMLGEPKTMQSSPEYADVVADVISFFQVRVEVCKAAGIATENIVLDPGFGFGKTLAHNLELLRSLAEIVEMGFPVLVGMSRKSMIGEMLHRPVDQRIPGGLALAMLARQKGAGIIRTHDVGATVDVLSVLEAV
jgi:dihydropteroate synthase